MSHRLFSGRRGWMALAVLALSVAGTARAGYVLLSWNDLGMHCMNKLHANMSILPPFNNVDAQLIQKGSAGINPVVITGGFSIEYSIPGNTYSVGKTDFWSYDVPLFGVNLPDNIGLTGKGLTGTLDWNGDHYRADGIPITPWTDANLVSEDPYQQAHLEAKNGQGIVVATSNPVLPVSTEIHCTGSGCHASENSIINGHEQEGGFNPNNRPILCARCHADPALGTNGIAEARYFSFRMHDTHKFIDQSIPGITGCYKCHPGPQTRCLRGTMNNDHGVICQDCHGNMATVANSISQGRVPWVNEPACRTCHTAQYGEPVGQLYKLAKGHGGVMCSGCHNSTHADFPSREARDNANMVALQGHSGILSDCTVCHGVIPSGPGPHGFTPTGVVETELLTNAEALKVSPSPMRSDCRIELVNAGSEEGRLLVFDAQGRTLRMLRSETGSGGTRVAHWDGADKNGQRVAPGVYFLRWEAGKRTAAAKVVLEK